MTDATASRFADGLGKAKTLLTLVRTHPREAFEIIRGELVRRSDQAFRRPGNYDVDAWSDAIAKLELALDAPLGQFPAEPSAARIRQEVNRGLAELEENAPFRLTYNADLSLAELCYVICRAVKPATVLETGVAYGVTSAFILMALEVNGNGRLHSVDLPPLGPDAGDSVGRLIPNHLRRRWTLHRGTSRRIFPSLLPSLDRVDLFIHDSQHTYREMLWEFRAVRPFLRNGGILVADDVQGNAAFERWIRQEKLAFSSIALQPRKRNLCGVSIVRGD